jgi:hypothetical protein
VGEFSGESGHHRCLACLRAPFPCAWGCRYALGTAYLEASHLPDFERALACLQGGGRCLGQAGARSGGLVWFLPCVALCRWSYQVYSCYMVDIHGRVLFRVTGEQGCTGSSSDDDWHGKFLPTLRTYSQPMFLKCTQNKERCDQVLIV